MAYANNNIYGNAAFTGMFSGCLAGRAGSSTAADYAALKAASLAFAAQVDSLIANDALVTTNAAVTQLAITTNTIAANEQWRAGLLHDLCKSVWTGKWSSSAVQADYAVPAAEVFAAWTEAVAGLVTP